VAQLGRNSTRSVYPFRSIVHEKFRRMEITCGISKSYSYKRGMGFIELT
jgi:hypothetical protein